jgi:hypothetical protein
LSFEATTEPSNWAALAGRSLHATVTIPPGGIEDATAASFHWTADSASDGVGEGGDYPRPTAHHHPDRRRLSQLSEKRSLAGGRADEEPDMGREGARHDRALDSVLALRPVVAGSGNRAWTTEPSHAPDAVTAGWSVVYGLIAAALTNVASRTAGGAVTAAMAVGTLLPLLVVPWRLHRRTATRLRRRANDADVAAGLGDGATEEARIAVLFGSGLNHRYLVKPLRDAAPGPPPGLDHLRRST